MEQTVNSEALGLFLLVRERICLHIHRMPYGTDEVEAMMVDRKLSAISINILRRG